MYLVDKYMKILKGHVNNHYRPEEVSIVKRNIVIEVIEFCSEHMPNCDPIGYVKTQRDGRC